MGWRRIGWLVPLLLALLIPARPLAAFTYYPPQPQGPIGIRRPAISQRILLREFETVSRAELVLDGQALPLRWDPAANRVVHTPAEPLATGDHVARLRVDVARTDDSRAYYDPLVTEFAFTIAPDALADLPAPDPEALRALQRVNAHRAAAGLPPMTHSRALGAAATGHARYLSENQTLAHAEIPGRPFYIGAGPLERARFFGYDQGVQEDLSDRLLAEYAVDEYLASLYHRLLLLRPGNTELGYGQAGVDPHAGVLLAGAGREDAREVAWPPPGQTDVPIGWSGAETPDPLRLYPGRKGPLGYTITLTFGTNPQRLTLDQATLNTAGGSPVPIMAFSPATDAELDDSVAVIPEEPLSPATMYTVQLAGQIDTGQGLQPYERRWSFRTAPASTLLMGAGGWRVEWQTLAGVLNEVAVTAAGADAQTRVFLGGLPVRSLRLDAGTLRFRPPAGFRGGGPAPLLLSAPDGTEVLVPNVFATKPVAYEDGQQAFRTESRQASAAGRSATVTVRVHLGGTVMVPERLLEELGARPTRIANLDRTYWTVAGRTGEVTVGRAVAEAAGALLRVPLPVQRIAGDVHIPAEFATALFGGQLFAGPAPEIIPVPAPSPTPPSLPPAPPVFADVASHWAAAAIQRLVAAGVVAGYGDGTFRPDQPLSRAAFVKLLVAARNLELPTSTDGGFTDTAGHWVAQQGYLDAARAAGFVDPADYPQRAFAPDQAITREEIAVMVVRALGLETGATARTVPVLAGRTTLNGITFTDADRWQRPGYVATAVAAGIVRGYPEASGLYTFRPDLLATRAEAAVMVTRLLDHPVPR